MRPALVQTLWADVIACTLRDAGVPLVVISPGSRSTPLVAALARAAAERSDFELVTMIDERAAAFYALGAARATGRPAVLVCTSGSAAAHYLPALVEASHAGVPLIAITANRPPELHDCGASQTIDQRGLYGAFARVSFELGAPVGEPLAMRAVRRKLVQAITVACGPDPGPVHLDAAFKKPLEPVFPSDAISSADDAERGLAAVVAELLAHPPLIAPPVLAPDNRAITQVARAIAGEPRGVIVVGALPAHAEHDAAAARGCSRDAIFELARRIGYPILAEAGSQLRFGPRPDDVVVIDHFDLIANSPTPSVIVQIGAEPVAAAWPAFSRGPAHWVLAGARWHDAESSANVVLGDIGLAIETLSSMLGDLETGRTSSRRRIERASASLGWLADWRTAEATAARCLGIALVKHPGNEVTAVGDALAALPPDAILQVGNSLPIRVVDQIHLERRAPLQVITQRGAAGIDGLIASAAGATRAGHPTLLVLGDVSFAHDLGGLLATRAIAAPLAILVIDNAGGRIFDGLPIGSANLGEAFEQHWLTAPQLDITAVAHAVGLRSLTATSSSAIASAITSALSTTAVTVIHAPVTATGARDVRATTLALSLQPRTLTPRSIAIPREPAPEDRIGGQP